jgi:hypothetical protein
MHREFEKGRAMSNKSKSLTTRSIVAGAALAVATALPAAAGFADGGVQQTDDIYGFADFYGVPHLGHETVSGTGCGGDGSVGDVIPDGWWRGYVRNFRATDLDFDLVCVYGTDVDPQLITDWTAQHPGQALPWVPDGFMINNNPRTRAVPLSPSFFSHGASWAGTACPFNDAVTGFDQSRDTWIRIIGGQAVFAVSSCAGVPSGPAQAMGYAFPYPTFYDVPRLGTEEVLGTGCGGNGTLGDTIPDGIWFGWITSLSATEMQFDVACIYIGATALQLENEWLSSPQQQADDPSPYFGGGGMWLVNNNDRTRTIPLGPGYIAAVANWSDPAAPNPNWPSPPGLDYACVPPVDPFVVPPGWGQDFIFGTGAWVQIFAGQAMYSLSECPHD